jgi:hypothetical protein
MAKKIALLILIVIAAILFYVYFFIISPIFVVKPNIQKPTLAAGQPVGEEHIEWLVNEFGAYKLHNSPLSGEKSETEILVTPANSYFSVVIENNVPSATAGRATDPDIRLTGARDVVASLLGSDNMIADAKAMSDEGKITLDILKDMSVLIPKGYKALYDELA